MHLKLISLLYSLYFIALANSEEWRLCTKCKSVLSKLKANKSFQDLQNVFDLSKAKSTHYNTQPNFTQYVTHFVDDVMESWIKYKINKNKVITDVDIVFVSPLEDPEELVEETSPSQEMSSTTKASDFTTKYIAPKSITSSEKITSTEFIISSIAPKLTTTQTTTNLLSQSSSTTLPMTSSTEYIENLNCKSSMDEASNWIDCHKTKAIPNNIINLSKYSSCSKFEVIQCYAHNESHDVYIEMKCNGSSLNLHLKKENSIEICQKEEPSILKMGLRIDYWKKSVVDFKANLHPYILRDMHSCFEENDCRDPQKLDTYADNNDVHFLFKIQCLDSSTMFIEVDHSKDYTYKIERTLYEIPSFLRKELGLEFVDAEAETPNILNEVNFMAYKELYNWGKIVITSTKKSPVQVPFLTGVELFKIEVFVMNETYKDTLNVFVLMANNQSILTL